MPTKSKTKAPQPEALRPEPQKKRELSIELLSRGGGASLNELIEATGWLPHSTRAVLTRLKQKGQFISKEKREGVTFYSIKSGSEDAA